MLPAAQALDPSFGKRHYVRMAFGVFPERGFSDEKLLIAKNCCDIAVAKPVFRGFGALARACLIVCVHSALVD